MIMNSCNQGIDNQLQLQVYNEQVSGKQPKLLTKDRRQILKGFNQIEFQFYQMYKSMHCSDYNHQMWKFIPKYYGVLELQNQPNLNINQNNEASLNVWLNHLSNRYKKKNSHNKFIVLENITFGWKMPNVFDIKIGGRNIQGKKHKITKSVLHFNIKLNGCKVTYPKGKVQQLFLSKYYLSKVMDLQSFIEYFGLFFFDGQHINIETIKILNDKMIDLILRFKALKGFKFISSSILLAYDALEIDKTDVRLLDFGRVYQKDPDYIDEESISGLQNILGIMKAVIQTDDKIREKILQLKEYYSLTQILVVPDTKILQY